MSDTAEDDENNKGFHIDKKGFHCIPCRCKRQIYHKETKTVKENDKVTTNTVVDKVNLKFGEGSNHQTKFLKQKQKQKLNWVALKYVARDGVKHKSHQRS